MVITSAINRSRSHGTIHGVARDLLNRRKSAFHCIAKGDQRTVCGDESASHVRVKATAPRRGQLSAFAHRLGSKSQNVLWGLTFTQNRAKSGGELIYGAPILPAISLNLVLVDLRQRPCGSPARSQDRTDFCDQHLQQSIANRYLPIGLPRLRFHHNCQARKFYNAYCVPRPYLTGKGKRRVNAFCELASD